MQKQDCMDAEKMKAVEEALARVQRVVRRMNAVTLARVQRAVQEALAQPRAAEANDLKVIKTSVCRHLTERRAELEHCQEICKTANEFELRLWHQFLFINLLSSLNVLHVHTDTPDDAQNAILSTEFSRKDLTECAAIYDSVMELKPEVALGSFWFELDQYECWFFDNSLMEISEDIESWVAEKMADGA